MSLAACSDMVQRGDPDRFASAMAAPPEARALLLPLYAFNLEVARAAWASEEAMIAEMRLQFWRDALETIGAGGRATGGDVLDALTDVIRARGLATEPLDQIVEARRWDIYREAFADEAAFEAHLQNTGGNLMWVAAQALGAGPEAEPVVRDFAYGAALANWLVAVPALEARGRVPLVDGRPEAVAALARDGLGRLRRARGQRGRVPATAAPALLAGWRAGPLLRLAVREPGRVAEGALVQSEFARRGGLLWRGVSGRW